MGYVCPTSWDELGWADLTGAPINSGTTITNGVSNIFKNPTQASGGFSYAYLGERGKKRFAATGVSPQAMEDSAH